VLQPPPNGHKRAPSHIPFLQKIDGLFNTPTGAAMYSSLVRPPFNSAAFKDGAMPYAICSLQPHNHDHSLMCCWRRSVLPPSEEGVNPFPTLALKGSDIQFKFALADITAFIEYNEEVERRRTVRITSRNHGFGSLTLKSIVADGCSISSQEPRTCTVCSCRPIWSPWISDPYTPSSQAFSSSTSKIKASKIASS